MARCGPSMTPKLPDQRRAAASPAIRGEAGRAVPRDRGPGKLRMTRPSIVRILVRDGRSAAMPGVRRCVGRLRTTGRDQPRERADHVARARAGRTVRHRRGRPSHLRARGSGERGRSHRGCGREPPSLTAAARASLGPAPRPPRRAARSGAAPGVRARCSSCSGGSPASQQLVDELLEVLGVARHEPADEVLRAADRVRLEHLGHRLHRRHGLGEPSLGELDQHERGDRVAERGRVDLGPVAR